MKIGPIIMCIFIFLIFVILLILSVDYVTDVVGKIVVKIRKRKHKKIIKKLKEMPTWDEICIKLLKGYGYTSRWDPVKQTFILENEEEKDGN